MRIHPFNPINVANTITNTAVIIVAINALVLPKSWMLTKTQDIPTPNKPTPKQNPSQKANLGVELFHTNSKTTKDKVVIGQIEYGAKANGNIAPARSAVRSL